MLSQEKVCLDKAVTQDGEQHAVKRSKVTHVLSDGVPENIQQPSAVRAVVILSFTEITAAEL